MPVAVNVLIERSHESVESVPVALRLFRDGAPLLSDTVKTGGPLGLLTTLASPTAQFLIPGSIATGTLTWQIEVDPDHVVDDSTRSNNIFPAAGPGTMRFEPLPPLHVHLVPITLSAHGDITGAVSSANGDAYLSALRSMLPSGVVTFSNGDPVAVSAIFGAVPEAGAPAFWRAALADLDKVRVASTIPDALWYGVVPIPSSVTAVVNGGSGFIPDTPQSVDAGSRTAMGVQASGFTSAGFAARTLARRRFPHRRHG